MAAIRPPSREALSGMGPSTVSTARPLAYRRSWWILATAGIAYYIDLFMRYNIPTVIPLLRERYHWNAATVGWIDAAFLIAYAAGQLPWGIVSERWLGARWTVSIGTAMIAVASIAFAVHIDSVALAIVARAMIGLGAAAVWVPVNPMLARWFAPRLRGMQTGLLAMGGALGTGAGGALMPIFLSGNAAILGLSATQSGFILSAVPGLVMMAVIPLVLRDRPEEIGLASLDAAPRSGPSSAEPGAARITFRRIMRGSPYPYVLTISYSGFIVCKYFVWTWFAAFLSAGYHVNVIHAGLLWAFIAAVPAALCQPLAGLASDRFGRSRTLRASLWGVAALCGLLALCSIAGPGRVPVSMVMLVAVLFSVFVNMWVLVWPYTTTLFPTSAAGPIGGFMNTVAQIAGSLAPIVSGYFIDMTGSYTSVFVCGIGCALVGLAAARHLPKDA